MIYDKNRSKCWNIIVKYTKASLGPLPLVPRSSGRENLAVRSNALKFFLHVIGKSSVILRLLGHFNMRLMVLRDFRSTASAAARNISD